MTTETTPPTENAKASGQPIVSEPCYFFGCVHGAGHYLHDENGVSSYQIEKRLPFRHGILDAGLLDPQKPQIQGHASISYLSGWTVVSFWDRSVDKRQGCNSAFIFPKKLEFSEALELSKVKFPWLWKRITFEIGRPR